MFVEALILCGCFLPNINITETIFHSYEVNQQLSWLVLKNSVKLEAQKYAQKSGGCFSNVFLEDLLKY